MVIILYNFVDLFFVGGVVSVVWFILLVASRSTDFVTFLGIATAFWVGIGVSKIDWF